MEKKSDEKEDEVTRVDNFPSEDWNELEYTIMQLLRGARFEGERIFSSWEPGRKKQYYFVKTKRLASEAEKFIDRMFNYQLQTFGMKWCLRVYGIRKDAQLPRREMRFLVSRTIRDYIKKLGIDEDEEGGGNSITFSDWSSKKEEGSYRTR